MSSAGDRTGAGSATGAAETARPRAHRSDRASAECRRLVRDDTHLGDPIPGLDPVPAPEEIRQRDEDLPGIVPIDRPRGVHHQHAPGGETAAGPDLEERPHRRPQLEPGRHLGDDPVAERDPHPAREVERGRSIGGPVRDLRPGRHGLDRDDPRATRHAGREARRHLGRRPEIATVAVGRCERNPLGEEAGDQAALGPPQDLPEGGGATAREAGEAGERDPARDGVEAEHPRARDELGLELRRVRGLVGVAEGAVGGAHDAERERHLPQPLQDAAQRALLAVERGDHRGRGQAERRGRRDPAPGEADERPEALGVALAHEEDVVPRARATLEELEAREPVDLADAPRLARELDRGPERSAPTDAHQLEAPSALEPEGLEQLDLPVPVEEAGREEPERDQGLGRELERDGLHRSGGEGFRYEPSRCLRVLNIATGSPGAMAYRSLGEFLSELERRGDLGRIRAPISRDLEIAEATQRAVRRDGPALLFENAPGSAYPIVTNLLGSPRRIALAFGDESVEATAQRVERLAQVRPPAGVLGALRDISGMMETLGTLRSLAPKHVRSGPCQEVEEARVDLDRIPILKCWPKDGGRTITFPIVITRDPETDEPHTGIYRLQQYGPDTLGFHAQIHRVGRNNLRKWAARGERMPVAVAIGADPATVFAGLAPVPEGMSNFVFAGFLRREPVELVKARTVDLDVPAEAEFVLEGYVDPAESRVEGPFGDHTGYYSAPEEFPVLHVTHVTHRERPVYLGAVTGKPPTEDAILGKAVERIFLPVVRLLLPEIVDMELPIEGLFINVGIVSIRKRYPGHARKVMHALWGLGQMMFTRYLVVVDEDVDVHDLREVLYRVGLQADPGRDIELSHGPVDQLAISNPVPNYGAKIGIDATRKGPDDGFPRPWPEEIRPDPTARAAIDRLVASDPVLAKWFGPAPP